MVPLSRLPFSLTHNTVAAAAAAAAAGSSCFLHNNELNLVSLLTLSLTHVLHQLLGCSPGSCMCVACHMPQIPSNLVVARVGVRRWLAFLLLGWGAVATCMSAIHSVGSFFALRLLLGAFEAGAVPAMWYHLSSFFPADRCACVRRGFCLLQQHVV